MKYAVFQTRYMEHPKWSGLSGDAFKLAHALICWALNESPDGFIPEATGREKAGGTRRSKGLLRELVDAGKPKHDIGILELVDGGYVVHEIGQYADLSTKRAQAGSKGGSKSSKRARKRQANPQANGVANPPSLVPPSHSPPAPNSPGSNLKGSREDLEAGRAGAREAVENDTERGRTATSKNDEARDPLARLFTDPRRDPWVKKAFAIWQRICRKPGAKLDRERAELLGERRDEGATHDDVEAACKGALLDEWVSGDAHCKLTVIFGKRERFEDLVELGRRGKGRAADAGPSPEELERRRERREARTAKARDRAARGLAKGAS